MPYKGGGTEIAMKIWAHRGCSQMYPENTITSFEKAMNIPGLAGIELDIQLTKDGELVVIHDERVDRTTDGSGFVRDFTLDEIRRLRIDAGEGQFEHIPTMREVFDLLSDRLKAYNPALNRPDGNAENSGGGDGIEDKGPVGLRLNIELKNSVYPYPGMEQKIVDMVHKYGVENSVVYSSFYARSLIKLHGIVPDAEIGMLDGKVSDCLLKAWAIERLAEDGTGFTQTQSGKMLREIGQGTPETRDFRFALHPGGGGIDINKEEFAGRPVRMWFGGHLYPEKPTPGKMDLDRLEQLGVTDVFLNEPEKYLNQNT